MRINDSGILLWSIWPNWSETKIQKVKCPIPDDDMPFWTLFRHCYLIVDLSNDFRQIKYLWPRFVCHLLTQMHSIQTWSYHFKNIQVLHSFKWKMWYVCPEMFLFSAIIHSKLRKRSISEHGMCTMMHLRPWFTTSRSETKCEHWTCNKCIFLFALS